MGWLATPMIAGHKPGTMVGPRRNVAPTSTLLALLALGPLAACSFDAAGLGPTSEGGSTQPQDPVTSGPSTGGTGTTAEPTTGPTTGPTTQTSVGTGSESGETSGSSGAVEPGTTTSTTDGTSTTDASTSTGADTTTGGSSSSGPCSEQAFFADDDGDGFGDPDELVMACEPPDGHVPNSDDCDDGDGAVRPDADEVCDGKDNDCDTYEDEFAARSNTDCEGCKMALYGGAVYHFCSTQEKWDDAKAACEGRGAALAGDDTMEEHTWLVAQLPGNSGPWHIGARAPDGDDKFKWLDDTAVPDPDPRWGALRPAAGGGSNYLTLVSDGNLGVWIGYNGRWYDRGANDKEPYVCEGPLH